MYVDLGTRTRSVPNGERGSKGDTAQVLSQENVEIVRRVYAGDC